MVAQLAATTPAPVLPKSAAAHTAAELTFLDCDDTTGIVHFAAPSAHEAGRINVVGLDTATGATFCTCRASECGRACWHTAHVAAAWLTSPTMLAVRWLTDDQLARYGRKHARMIAAYRTRIARALADDMLALVAARSEYRRRAALVASRFQLGIGSANAVTEGDDVVIAHVANRHLLPLVLPVGGDFPHDPTDGAGLAA